MLERHLRRICLDAYFKCIRRSIFILCLDVCLSFHFLVISILSSFLVIRHTTETMDAMKPWPWCSTEISDRQASRRLEVTAYQLTQDMTTHAIDGPHSIPSRQRISNFFTTGQKTSPLHLLSLSLHFTYYNHHTTPEYSQ